jgi:predicted XRE-type DNA-binding protein
MATDKATHMRRKSKPTKITTGRKVRAAKVTASGGNVFADLGVRNPEDHLLKAEFVREIALTMKEQGLTQAAAARVLRVTQPDVSKMLRGHFRQFSIERLMRFLVLLGRDVQITVVPTTRHPKITVTALAR